MKLRFVIIIGFIPLLALLLVQAYVVNEFYKLKSNAFDTRYGREVNIAFSLLGDEIDSNPLDSVSKNLSRFSYNLFESKLDYDFLQEDAKIRGKIYNEFEAIIRKHERITPFVKAYLKLRGLENDLASRFFIRELTLINGNQKYEIYKKAKSKGLQGGESDREGKIFVRKIGVETDYYRFVLDFYIDFTGRRAIILHEMKGVLAVVSLTLLSVLLVFIATVRNLLRQKKLSDVKSDFINNMTHELKTPLSTIAVASSSLTMEQVLKDKEKSKSLSEIIKKQNKHLTHMIDHILEIGVLDRDKFKLNTEEVEILPFMREIVDAFRVECEDKREIEIIEDYAVDEKDSVKIDKHQITRVINNLLTNAIKYSDDKPVVKLSVEGNDGFVIRVEDNGLGIGKEDQKHVFTKFYRCNHDHKHKVKGLGLGLYFVQQIIESHKGTIQLKSTLGKGSIFTIRLPKK